MPRVLLVEDNPDDVAFARLALSRAGEPVDLDVASDGRAALAALTEAGAGRAPFPDLVLLDLKLPLVDGKEVLRRVRAEAATREVPVVVLSSSADPRDVLDCYLLGADSYFVKPIDLQEFCSGASVLIHYWLRLNASARRPSMPDYADAVAALSLSRHSPPSRAAIAIVDPDPDARALTAQGVAGETTGTVHTFATIAESLTRLRELDRHWSGCPHLLIVERDLADGHVAELMGAIRAELDHRIAVVQLARTAAPADVVDFRRIEGNGIVAKPRDADTHRAVAAVIARYWLRLNRLPADRL